jgi:hypothetical protein
MIGFARMRLGRPIGLQLSRDGSEGGRLGRRVSEDAVCAREGVEFGERVSRLSAQEPGPVRGSFVDLRLT